MKTCQNFQQKLKSQEVGGHMHTAHKYLSVFVLHTGHFASL